jgi:hypothetical protein
MTEHRTKRMRSPTANRRLVERWNERHPAGTAVLYRPVLGREETRPTRTRGAAYMLGDQNAVVMIDGVAGCVSLWHVEVAPSDSLPPTKETR